MTTVGSGPLLRAVHHDARRGCRAAAERWLLNAATNPAHARTEWAVHGVALLRCGRVFTAVRIPARYVHAAAGTDSPAEVAEFLVRALGGGVFVDPRHSLYYAVTTASTARYWRCPGVECFGPETYLGVPAVSRTKPAPGPYWAVPLDGPGALCGGIAVERLVIDGREASDERGEQGA